MNDIKTRALLVAAIGCLTGSAMPVRQDPTLEETRLALGKWIETQQIISKERNEWQQGKEILLGRLELVRKEVGTLAAGIQETKNGVAETEKRRAALLADKELLLKAEEQLKESVLGLEIDLRRLEKSLPEPLRARIQPLLQRMPDDPATTRISVAERYQNVIGILNEIDKASCDLAINYEVHTLADGKPSEVKVIYVGLTQAYFVSSTGEAGIGRPTPAGWTWEPSKTIADDVSTALEILQGKQSPAFVPLPVKLP